MKAAIYARVSTKDQDEETQVEILQKAAEIHNWEVVKVYRDRISGAKDSRPGLNQMIKDLHQGKFQAIIVLRLARLGRTQGGLIKILEDCRSRGAHIVALHDGIDTTTSTGKMLYGILAAIYELERERIAERTQERMDRLKAAGVQLGRPSLVDPSTPQGKRRRSWIINLHKDGNSQRHIAHITGTSRATVSKVLKEWQKKVPPAAGDGITQEKGGGTPPGRKRSINSHQNKDPEEQKTGSSAPDVKISSQEQTGSNQED